MKKSIILLLGAVSVTMLADETAVDQSKPSVDDLKTGYCNNSHYTLQFNHFSAGVYIINDIITPEEFDPAGEPAKVFYMPIQHAYAASMDIDLAPKMKEKISQPYENDGFDKMFLEWTGLSEEELKKVQEENRNYGFRFDDHDYALIYYWKVGSTSSTNFWGTIVFHNASAKRFFEQTIKSTDGEVDDVSEHEVKYHPHTVTTKHFEEQDWKQEITHYCMMCGIGVLGGYVVAGEYPVSEGGDYLFWNTGVIGD